MKKVSSLKSIKAKKGVKIIKRGKKIIAFDPKNPRNKRKQGS